MKDYSLPKIFNHAKYAEAARQDHDERERSAENFYRATLHSPTTGSNSAVLYDAIALWVGVLLGIVVVFAVLNFTIGSGR